MQHCHYRIQFAEPNRIPELRRLWSDIFGDSDDYTALFFSRVYAPGRALIATVDEQVAAMLFFPARRMALQGKPVRVGYVCGAATRPEYRGRGIMAAMLAAAHRHMQRAGDIGAVLIPASESLYAYYAKSGYREYFYQDTRALRACDTRTAAAPALLTPRSCPSITPLPASGRTSCFRMQTVTPLFWKNIPATAVCSFGIKTSIFSAGAHRIRLLWTNA